MHLKKHWKIHVKVEVASKDKIHNPVESITHGG